MFQYSINKVKGSIFPIFRFGSNGYGAIGTGFFIDEFGHFLTAHHVVANIPQGSQLGYLGNVPNAGKLSNQFIPISIIKTDPAKDLALGFVKSGALPSLTIANSSAAIGQSVVLCGYPFPMIKHHATVNNAAKSVSVLLDVSNVRQYWQPTIIVDSINPNALYNKPFNSFLTQDASLSGMSGGPVFNRKGEVVGIATGNWTRQIPRSNAPNLMVENGIGIDLVEIKSFVSPIPALLHAN